MKAPRISVVVPSYEQAAFLERAITSITSQPYDNVELFVMDGGSTDGSVDVIRSHEPSITAWRSEPDDGQGPAVIDGWQQASGDLITWLNSDDLMLPGAFETSAELFATGADVIIGETVLIDEADIITAYRPLYPGPRWMYASGMIPVGQPGTFYRRSLVEDVGYFDRGLQYAMEFDLWHRLMARGAVIARADRPLAALRIYEDTKSSKFASELEAENRMIRERYSSERAAAVTAASRRVIKYPYLLRYAWPPSWPKTRRKIDWIRTPTAVHDVDWEP